MKLRRAVSLLMSVCLLVGANCVSSFASDADTSERLQFVFMTKIQLIFVWRTMIGYCWIHGR